MNLFSFFGYLIILLILIFFSYRVFGARIYWVIIFFLLLGESYNTSPEKIFGFINLGVHIFSILPGITLYSKDIVLVIGVIIAIFAYRHKRIPQLYFFNSVVLFLLLILMNFITKSTGISENFSPNQIKTIIRLLSPFILYFIIYYTFDPRWFERFYYLISFCLIVTTIYSFFSILTGGVTIADTDELRIQIGDITTKRYAIPHAFMLFIPYFLSLGIISIRPKNRNLLIVALISIILLLIVGTISTYRAYAFILIIGAVTTVMYMFKSYGIIKNIVFIIGFLFLISILIKISSLLVGYNILEMFSTRFDQSFEEISTATGTGGGRIEIIKVMLTHLMSRPEVFLFGKMFTTEYLSIYGINSDIGIVSTITQAGIFILLPIFFIYNRVWIMRKLKCSDPAYMIIRNSTLFFFVSTFPSMLFNFDFWFQISLAQSLFFFLGIFDVFYYEKIAMPRLVRGF